MGLTTASIISPFLIASENTVKIPSRKIPAALNPVFKHGVASGDPLSDRIVLWTRISGATEQRVVVNWQISEDDKFFRIVNHGLVQTDAEQDYTVKIDVDGLNPDSIYYYRFKTESAISAVGRTRTLPLGDIASARFAVVSCSNYCNGYFNLYRVLSQLNDISAIIHLGDYLYETNLNSHEGEALPGRKVVPDREILSLDDYRQRHAHYKMDPDLQVVHQNHAFITVWDDHEIANDAWQGGAGNHNHELGEGDWQERKKAAIKAYFEWMPIRNSNTENQQPIYRHFAFGNLVDLIMLDTRIAGRDAPSVENQNDSSRSILGSEQESWLYDTLNYSKQMGTQWRLIGQQVMLGQLSPMGQTLNFDQWDGYPQCRKRLLETIRDNEIDNIAFLTGDIHSSWGNEIALDPYDVTAYDPQNGKGSLAVEFVAPAITSQGVVSTMQATLLEQLIYSSNPHTHYTELTKNGYMLVDVNRERIQVDYHYIDTITALSDNVYLGQSLRVADKSNRISKNTGFNL